MIFLFAWRYFKAKKTTNAINIIAWISIMAIVIGTASLILVLSVFNGFEGLVKSLYSSFYPELKISPSSGKQMVLTPDQVKQLKFVNGVKMFSLVAEEKAMLQKRENETDSSNNLSRIYLKGVDSNYKYVTGVAGHIVEGEFNIGTTDDPFLVLGSGIQSAMGIKSERNAQPLMVYMPRKGIGDQSDPSRLISSELVNTSGTFYIQQDFDDKYAITNLGFVKKMLGMDENMYSSVEISIQPSANITLVKNSIKKLLGQEYQVQDRFEQNASLYSVMNIEKWIIYAILTLILVVAAFNMVGALTMLVLEKESDINVLHALGADRSFIQKIFLSEGLLLGFIGGGTGMVLAFIIATLQLKFHLIPLQGSTFMIDYFPVKLVLKDFLLVGGTVMIIALLASWLPARRASIINTNLAL